MTDNDEWTNLIPYDRRQWAPITLGQLRQAIAGLPDDALVESGYYTCIGAEWNASTNTLNIVNDE